MCEWCNAEDNVNKCLGIVEFYLLLRLIRDV